MRRFHKDIEPHIWLLSDKFQVLKLGFVIFAVLVSVDGVLGLLCSINVLRIFLTASSGILSSRVLHPGGPSICLQQWGHMLTSPEACKESVSL